MFWGLSKVVLKITLGLKLVKLNIVIHLTFHKRKETVAYAHDWEMTIFVLIMHLSPLKNFLNSFSEGIISMRDQALGVSRNIEAI